MKKIIFILMIAFAFSSQVKAANYIYNVTVTISVDYYLYDRMEGEVAHSTGANETQIIPVCASSPEDARTQAKKQCSIMCEGAQEFGTGEWKGKTLPRYKRRTVYDAVAFNTQTICN